MSDKKEWREFWVSFVKNAMGQNLPFHAFGSNCYTKACDDCSKGNNPMLVIEHAAYEAEKQRADRVTKDMIKIADQCTAEMRRADEQHEEIKSLALECATLHNELYEGREKRMELAQRADALEKEVQKLLSDQKIKFDLIMMHGQTNQKLRDALEIAKEYLIEIEDDTRCDQCHNNMCSVALDNIEEALK